VERHHPIPTIIVFGIATATRQRLTEKSVCTEFGMSIGTSEYTSPDRAELTGLDVDTRADVGIRQAQEGVAA